MNTSEEAEILPADKSLLKKVGIANLDALLTPKAIEKAEVVIAKASEDLYLDCVGAAVKLLAAASLLENGQNLGPRLQKIVPLAFFIKNEAAQSGYDLIAALAESLQRKCENLNVQSPVLADVRIVMWHAQSIVKLLTLRVKADGGKTGREIREELEKLRSLAAASAKIPA